MNTINKSVFNHSISRKEEIIFAFQKFITLTESMPSIPFRLGDLGTKDGLRTIAMLYHWCQNDSLGREWGDMIAYLQNLSTTEYCFLYANLLDFILFQKYPEGSDKAIICHHYQRKLLAISIEVINRYTPEVAKTLGEIDEVLLSEYKPMSDLAINNIDFYNDFLSYRREQVAEFHSLIYGNSMFMWLWYSFLTYRNIFEGIEKGNAKKIVSKREWYEGAIERIKIIDADIEEYSSRFERKKILFPDNFGDYLQDADGWFYFLIRHLKKHSPNDFLAKRIKKWKVNQSKYLGKIYRNTKVKISTQCF